MSTDTVEKAVSIVPPNTTSVDEMIAADFEDFRSPEQFVVTKMTELVKGAGMAVSHKSARAGEVVAPLTDRDEVYGKAMEARKCFLGAVRQGVNNPDAVFKGLNPDFMRRYGAFGSIGSPQNQWMAKIVAEMEQAIGKSFTTTIPLSTGLAPVNLRAPW